MRFEYRWDTGQDPCYPSTLLASQASSFTWRHPLRTLPNSTLLLSGNHLAIVTCNIVVPILLLPLLKALTYLIART
jgi:hypothetical protein